jgi:hypothetical protein
MANEPSDIFAFTSTVANSNLQVRVFFEPDCPGNQGGSCDCIVQASYSRDGTPYGWETRLAMGDPRTIGQAVDELCQRLFGHDAPDSTERNSDGR